MSIHSAFASIPRSIHFSQVNLPVRLETALDESLGKDFLSLIQLDATEAISSLYEYSVVASSKAGLVDFSKIIGTSARIVVKPGSGSNAITTGWPEEYFHGIVRSVDEIDADAGSSIYQISIVPQHWLLTRNRRFRVFQAKTVEQILKAVLGEQTVDYRLKEGYEPYDYCVQYGESDFDFVSRLMEQEGIFYYFQHDASGYRLVIADRSRELRNLPGSSTIPYTPEGDQRRVDSRRVDRFRKRQQIDASAFGVVDDCFETTGVTVRHEASLPADLPIGAARHRLHYDVSAGARTGSTDNSLGPDYVEFPARFANRVEEFDGAGASRIKDVAPVAARLAERSAQLETDRRTLQAFRIGGESPYFGFRPGYAFELTDHPSSSGAYTITRVHHRYAVAAQANDGNRIEYANEFTCIPAASTYRPERRTQRPIANGSQTATVVANDDDEITTEPYGRVKVRFHWNAKSVGDLQCSCWVRVAQAWAGKSWGALFLPRKGQEVVVDFLNGDPDRPIILGGVYNKEHRPPVTLPEGRTVSGIMSHTHAGDTLHYGGLKFDDAKGKEAVELRSHRDMSLTCGNDLHFYVPNDIYQMVGGQIKTYYGSLAATPPSGDPKGDNDNFGKNHEKWWKSTKDAFDQFARSDANVTPRASFDMTCKFGGSIDANVGIGFNTAVGGDHRSFVDPVGLATNLLPASSPASAAVKMGLTFLTGALGLGRQDAVYGAVNELEGVDAFQFRCETQATRLHNPAGVAGGVLKVGVAAHALALLLYNYVVMVHGSTTPKKWLLTFAAAPHLLYQLIMVGAKAYAASREQSAAAATRRISNFNFIHVVPALNDGKYCAKDIYGEAYLLASEKDVSVLSNKSLNLVAKRTFNCNSDGLGMKANEMVFETKKAGWLAKRFTIQNCKIVNLQSEEIHMYPTQELRLQNTQVIGKPTLMLTKAGITLSYHDNVIELGDNGITLSAAKGASSLVIGSESITINTQVLKHNCLVENIKAGPEPIVVLDVPPPQIDDIPLDDDSIGDEVLF